MFKELMEKYNSIYGRGNWCIRKVSRLRKNKSSPSLTIVSELKVVGIKPDEYVVVAVDVENKKIIIEKIQ